MKDPAFAKFVIFVNSSVPLALLCWDTLHHHLGAEPVTYALHTTGMLGLIFLILSLLVTPARLVSGWNFLSHFRRMLGLFAFFYGLIHFTIYLWFNMGWSLLGTLRDTRDHPYILMGMTSLLLMLPLALTSTNGMIKRLGAAKWKRLHKLVYISAIAAAIHYQWLVKADHRLPLSFITALAILLLYRLLVPKFPFLKRGRKPAKPVITAKPA